MCVGKIRSFDISRKQRAMLEWKYARKVQLRQQYLKECLNPTMRVMPVDGAVQRLISLRHNHDYVSSIRLVPHLLFGFTWFGLIYYLSDILKAVKDVPEKLYRTGQVTYADREYIFA